MKARVLSVYDDGAAVGTRLIGAKGLSILVEADGRRILFDTGRRGAYLNHNLDHLGIPKESIDAVVLSHGHRDHTGGLNGFLEGREAPVDLYSQKDVWVPRAEVRMGLRVGIGAPLLKDPSKVTEIHVEGRTPITDRLSVLPLPPSGGGQGYRRRVNGRWEEDVIGELAMVLMTRKGPVLICGCCHPGLPAALAAVRAATGQDAAAVIGGIHLVKAGNAAVDSLAASLRDSDRTPMLHLCHCTSPDAMTRLRMTLGLAGVRDFYAGTEVRFDV